MKSLARAAACIGAVIWTPGLLAVLSSWSRSLFRYRRASRSVMRIDHGARSCSRRWSAWSSGLRMVRRGAVAVRRAARAVWPTCARVSDRRRRRTLSERSAAAGRRSQRAARPSRCRRSAARLRKAGDLAHGLKTPLAVLSHEAERAERRGAGRAGARRSRSRLDRMRRQIDYHLAHARAAASGAAPGARCSVAESAEALARTLLRLHADRGLDIDVARRPRITPSAASARTSTRCSATCSTTPASGRGRA